MIRLCLYWPVNPKNGRQKYGFITIDARLWIERSGRLSADEASSRTNPLAECSDDLTRANIMKQAAAIHSLQPEVLLPGVAINTSATDFASRSTISAQEIQGRSVGIVR